MTVKINNQPVDIPEGTTLASLAASQNLPAQGVAVAVNNAMVPRADWEGRTLCDGDDIVILKAFCGG